MGRTGHNGLNRRQGVGAMLNSSSRLMCASDMGHLDTRYHWQDIKHDYPVSVSCSDGERGSSCSSPEWNYYREVISPLSLGLA